MNDTICIRLIRFTLLQLGHLQAIKLKLITQQRLKWNPVELTKKDTPI